MDVDKKGTSEVSSHHSDRLKPMSEQCIPNQHENVQDETKPFEQRQINKGNKDSKNFIGGPSSWYAAIIYSWLLHFEIYILSVKLSSSFPLCFVSNQNSVFSIMIFSFSQGSLLKGR